MNLLIPIIDSVFRGRAVAPSVCITENANDYFLVEDSKVTKTCVFVSSVHLSEAEIEQGYFSVYNPTLQDIHLWAIDGCFMLDHEPTRCDCILFTDKEFCFIEFKLDATSSLPRTILNNRKKASSQLQTTIEFVKNAVAGQIVFERIQYGAYLCSPPHYPSKDTSLSDKRIEFLENYGVMLFEEREKHFS